MSSRRIGSTPFLELLPDSIAGDPAIRAAADALDGLLVPSVKAIPSLLLYARLYGKEPDLLPPLRRLAEQAGGLRALEEPLLDLLAWQLHVDNYDIARTYAERLEMVKTAIAVHRKKGTPWAVETAVTAALGKVETTVTEWYDYEGGQPYHFKVLVTLFEQGIVADDTTAPARSSSKRKTPVRTSTTSASPWRSAATAKRASGPCSAWGTP